MNHTVRFVFANIARLLGAVFVAVAGLCFVTAIAAQSSAVNASVPNGTASNEGLRLVAQKNVSLANENLARSRDRFTSGVTDSVEVVQSEQSLASAIGVARTGFKQYIGGQQCRTTASRPKGILPG